MRAAFYTRTGDAADVLQIGDRPDPTVSGGDVLVRVHASGINPADVKRRAGWLGAAMDHPLVIPHADGAGDIVDVGSGVSRERIGERVWLWNAQGGYGEAGRAFGTAAQYISLPSEQAVHLPDAFDYTAGACLGIPAMTAWWAVHTDGPVDGQTILVNGASGAVGHLAVQFAVAGGATVIGTVGRDEGRSHARAAGVSHVVNRHSENLAEQILDLTGGTGVHRIIEVDFGANLQTDAAVLRTNGTIAAYSSTRKPEPVLPYYAFASKGANLRFIQGFAIPEEARLRGEQAIAELAAAGQLKIAVAETYPLDQIPTAHEAVERGSIGNIVVTL